MNDDSASSVRPIGEEARRSHARRMQDGFVGRYLSGDHILDIGYKGYIDDALPIVPQAVGVELDYPGYDGRTLPFADGSQDAVFASHCLEHIGDFAQALGDWLRVLRTGGFLAIMVPHQFLYEKRAELPSQFNADHRRFYTPASLMSEVEMALSPNTYRLRHLADNDRQYNYAIPPASHPDGCYEIELVLEKIAPPDWTIDRICQPAQADAIDPVAWGTAPTDDVVRTRAGGMPRTQVLTASPWDVAIYDFSPAQPRPRRILAMQLGHMGDFIIGLPALRQLREAFPGDHIRLVTGTWNRGTAEATGLADEVTTHNHFPEVARGWDRRPVQDAEAFARAASGRYDIAVDLRVDSDTRHLLEHVDAAMRAGIGATERFPFLDAALPTGVPAKVSTDRPESIMLPPGRFTSRMSRPGPFHQTHDYRRTNTHMIYGAGLVLRAGRFRATFALSLTGIRSARAPIRIVLDVLQGSDARVLAERVLAAANMPIALGDSLFVDFDNEDDETPLDFRVHIAGRPLLATLAFGGVRIDSQSRPPAMRRTPASLHIGEQLSMLVRLVADRTRALYPVPPPPQPTPLPPTFRVSASRYRVVIAPVSNSDLRDWPPAHYATLTGMLAHRLDCAVLLTGSRAQAAALGRIARDSGAGERVLDLAGRTEWADLPGILQGADLVICNNSGIAHLAASLGVRTLALYSGSHQPQEWGPRGAASRALMAVVPCSPCGLDRLIDCPHEHACMQELAPETVFAQVREWLDQPGLRA